MAWRNKVRTPDTEQVLGLPEESAISARCNPTGTGASARPGERRFRFRDVHTAGYPVDAQELVPAETLEA